MWLTAKNPENATNITTSMGLKADRLTPVPCTVLSAAAISREFGVMDHHMCEVEVCRILVERAERVIVAADASKFTAKGLIAACPLAEIDLLVTDAPPPAELAQALEAADVELMVA